MMSKSITGVPRSCLRTMRALSLMLLLLAPPALADGKLNISSEQWARISTVADFMNIAGLREMVSILNQNHQAELDIHYAGGESGQLWAQQFRNRMIGLGIEGNRIQLVQGVSQPSYLEIRLRARP